MFVDAIRCPKCDKTVWSRFRHDWRHCPCGYCSVDGGRDYTKVGFGGPEWEKPWEKPEMITLEVPDEGNR